MIKVRVGISMDADEAGRRDRQGRAVGAQRVPGGARAGEQPDRRAQPAEGRGAVDEPQGDRLRRARARRGEQQAALREPAAAHEGDRRLGSELKTSNIRVVDEAERPRTRCRRGSAEPAAGAHRRRDPGVRPRVLLRVPRQPHQDAGRTQGAPRPGVLGMVPALDENLDGPYPLLSAGVPPNFAEAFRAIRTNVLFSSAEEGSRALVVTSTGPGEGKTTVAPTSPWRSRRPGSACCSSTPTCAGRGCTASSTERRSPAVEPDGGQREGERACARRRCRACGAAAGRIPPNPAELLGSQRFKEFREAR